MAVLLRNRCRRRAASRLREYRRLALCPRHSDWMAVAACLMQTKAIAWREGKRSGGGEHGV